MEIKFKKCEVCDLIQRYYKEVENVDANVKISASREPTGIFEKMSCVTRIQVKKSTTVLGVKTEVTEYLTKEEVLGIFNELLKDSEYQITNLSYDAGVGSQSVGYFMNEHTEYRAYFNGIILYVKSKEKDNNNTLNKKLI